MTFLCVSLIRNQLLVQITRFTPTNARVTILLALRLQDTLQGSANQQMKRTLVKTTCKQKKQINETK